MHIQNYINKTFQNYGRYYQRDGNPAADKYGVEKLKNMGIVHISKSLTKENVCKRLLEPHYLKYEAVNQ